MDASAASGVLNVIIFVGVLKGWRSSFAAKEYTHAKIHMSPENGPLKKGDFLLDIFILGGLC